MIESITVTNFKGESLLIELSNPSGSGLAVIGITGLGPVKADINTVSHATRNGSQFSSARVDNRNIVFRFLFMPSDGDTIEDVRQRTYQYFPVMSEVALVFKTGSRNARIKGYVEANEPDIFSERETTQISIICTDPYFYDNSTKQQIAFLEKRGMFSFPFFNSGNVKEIKMGEIYKMTVKSLTYNGDAPTGIIMTLSFFGEVRGKIFICNKTTGQTLTLDTSQLVPVNRLGNGDVIEISTLPGEKYARLIKNGSSSYSDILECVDICTLDVVGGENQFEITTDSSIDGDFIELSITTTETFEGI